MKKILTLCLCATLLLTSLALFTSCTEKRTLHEGSIYEMTADEKAYYLDEIDEAFSGTEFVLPTTVNDLPVIGIGDDAFAYKTTNIEKVKLHDGVTMIGSKAFYNCATLTEVNIPEGVTAIGDFAFAGCTALKSIKLPNSVTSLGHSVFTGCEALTSVQLPQGLKQIGESMFEGCTSLTTVEIPEGVTTIGRNAFASCHSLSGIDIPDAVTTIEGYAFNGCDSLVTVRISKNVTGIDGILTFVGDKLEAIIYDGTIEEWEQISGTSQTGDTWHYEVRCSDGTIEKT